MYYTDKIVDVCPYCGQAEMIESYQSSYYASIAAVDNIWGGCTLYHVICRNCGSVVRSYVKNPEKLLRRRDRKIR